MPRENGDDARLARPGLRRDAAIPVSSAANWECSVAWRDRTFEALAMFAFGPEYRMGDPLAHYRSDRHLVPRWASPAARGCRFDLPRPDRNAAPSPRSAPAPPELRRGPAGSCDAVNKHVRRPPFAPGRRSSHSHRRDPLEVGPFDRDPAAGAGRAIAQPAGGADRQAPAAPTSIPARCLPIARRWAAARRCRAAARCDASRLHGIGAARQVAAAPCRSPSPASRSNLPPKLADRRCFPGRLRLAIREAQRRSARRAGVQAVGEGGDGFLSLVSPAVATGWQVASVRAPIRSTVSPTATMPPVRRARMSTPGPR